MSGQIDFSVWSPDEATFWASWVNAGIIEIVDGERQFTAEYPGINVTAGHWPGSVIKTPEVTHEDGTVTPAVLVTGWHCNVRVMGPLVAEMTYGLAQTDADGNLRNLFDRTWAVQIFQLTEQLADINTGFPSGYRNVDGVTYCDTRDIKSPDNKWL